MEKMFETATRNKMRFPYKGQISVEDLWDLPLESLDHIFKTLNSQIKQAKEESLLNKKSKEDEYLESQIEIVKYIVSVKLYEDKQRVQAKEMKERKQKIMSILETKQEEDLHNKSVEELQAMLNEMNS